MTITYTLKVSNSRLCGFSKLLFHWKGSVYKLVYKEMLIFLSLYYTLSLVYRLALGENQKRIFEKVVIYFQNFLDLIPLTFVLGFYVAIVVSRWWNQYLSIPWPDRLMGFVSTLVHGNDERGRLIRRTLMRWLNLSHVLVMQSISIVVKKRFPTMQHLVDAGLMTSSEKRKLKNLPTPHNIFWVPTMWFSTLVNQCMEEGRIRDEIHLKTLLDEVTGFKASLGMLYSYDWISIPLVYTQVTTIAVYGFFFACLMGRQYIESSAENPTLGETDLYVPLFTLMQFFFYMGWLKVAEVLINPFGEDEDDFETNWMIDRNYQVAMLGVDELYGDMPELEKDMYWDDLEPELPYTKSTICHKNEPFMGSTADFSLDPEDIGSQMVNPMETIPEVGRAPTPGEANTPHSPVSSPTKLRRFLANITSAFSQESITDSKPAGLHIKDPLFSHSPLLQRVKSSSVKRSLSHTDHLGPHRRIGSLSNVDVSCGSMGQPIITHVSVVAPNGHSWKHSNRPGPTHVSLLKDNSQRSLSSKASLAVNVRDAPLKTSDITSPYLSATGPCNPSGVFYKKPDPFELLGNNNAAGSAQQLQYNTDHTHDNDRRQGLQKDNGAALNTFYTNSSLEHSQPAEHPLPPNGNTVDRCDAQSSYTNPIATLCFSDNRSTAFVGEVHPTAVLGTSEAVSSDQNACNVFTPVAPSTAVWSNPNPAAFYSDYHAETPVRQDVAQCNSVWSNNGATPASLNASASHITSTSTLQPSSSAQPVPDQAYHPGTSTPVQTGPTNNHSLLERKADSEDSIDSTYDSSYDTINSQEPLLEASSHWEKHV